MPERNRSAEFLEIGFGTRVVFGGSIAIAAGLSALHLERLIDVVATASWIGPSVGVLAGILAADLVTGVLHWACDTWGDEHTPWIGASLIRSFREHHRSPRAMLDHHWIEVNGQGAAATGAGFLLWMLADAALPLQLGGFGFAFLWSLLSFSALTNQVHRWAHMETPPALVRRLQDAGLFLSRSGHDPHHCAPHMTGYCIFTGWCNGPLDRLGVWRHLERSITLVTGARPRTEAQPAGGSGR